MRSAYGNPVITFGRFVGGSAQDYACSVKVSASGDIYLVSETNSSDFPTTPGAFRTSMPSATTNIAVTKLSSTGDILYSTYIGAASSANRCGGSFVDASGRVYVTGWTYGSDFPTTTGAYQRTARGAADAFLLILSADGSTVEYSTLFGGGDYEWPMDMAVDSLGRAWIVGESGHGSVAGFHLQGNLPLRNEAQISLNGLSDGFVALIDPTQAIASDQLVYATYLGGSGQEILRAITLDRAGNPWITGTTTSSNYPTRNAYRSTLSGATDVIVTSIDPRQLGSDTVTYSTYFGGSGREFGGDAIALTSAGRVIVTGNTRSTDFPLPVTPPPADSTCAQDGTCEGFADAFLLLLDPQETGTDQLIYGTYFGGSAFDYGQVLLPLPGGELALGGVTQSANLPFPTNTRGVSSGGFNAFISFWDLDADPTLSNSVILQSNTDDFITSMAPINANQFIVAGYSSSSSFAGLDPATFHGQPDAYVLRMNYTPPTTGTPAGSGGASGGTGGASGGTGGSSGSGGTTPSPAIIPGQEYRVGGNAGCSLLSR